MGRGGRGAQEGRVVLSAALCCFAVETNTVSNYPPINNTLERKIKRMPQLIVEEWDSLQSHLKIRQLHILV